MNDQESNHNLLDELSADAPIERMRSRFGEMAADPSRESRRPMTWLTWAAASVVLLGGLLIVWRKSPVPSIPDTKTETVLEMLEAPSSFERLRGVNVAADLPRLPPSLRSALFKRLERDESVSVRLSVIDALLGRDLSVQESSRLAGLLPSQDTAIVQAHLGYQLRRRRVLSRAELERILNHSEIQNDARNALVRLEES